MRSLFLRKNWQFFLLIFFVVAVGSQIFLLRHLPEVEPTIFVSTTTRSIQHIPPKQKQHHRPRDNVLSHSLVHCVGDNFLPNAWIYRSCQYRNLCWKDGEWVIYSTPNHAPLDSIMANNDDDDDSVYARSSTTHNSSFLTVSATGTTPWWSRKKKYMWSPKVVVLRSSSQQALPLRRDNMVVVPIMVTPGEKSTMTLLMDTLLPIYNLVTMFGWENNNKRITIVPLNPEECDSSTACDGLQQYVEDWMGYQLLLLNKNSNSTSSSSSSFCANYGAAGMGMLTATGLSRRGHNLKDYSIARNTGRGPSFWDFTRHVLNQLQISIPRKTTSSITTVVQVAMGQPDDHPMKSLLYRGLKRSLNSTTTSIHDIFADDKRLFENKKDTIISVAANSNVWIAIAKDEYTWPAMFLPRGSTLILLYDETQQVKGGGANQQQQRRPVMEDFDVWNHMSHLKVHWLSLQQQEEEEDHLVQVIFRLIQEQMPKSSAISNSTGDDLTFNGKRIDLVHRSPLPSKVHCVGENWEWDSMNYRSCHIENLCFDVAKRTFVMTSSSPSERTPQQQLQTYDVLATNEDTQVMMGQSVRLGTGTPWFPNRTITMSSSSNVDKYYSLESNVIWLPYYAEQPNANNPGHLLWDYWLPLYNLVDMFGYQQQQQQQQHEKYSLLLTNLDPWCVSYSPYPCYNMTTKFLSLLGVHPSTFFNSYNPRLKIHGGGKPESNLVCAPRGLAGIGMLTDHGFKKHGQLIDDYRNVRNVGRGVTFWGFRNYMLRNMGMMVGQPSSSSKLLTSPPYKVTFSINSSNNLSRRRAFQNQIHLVERSFPSDLVVVQTVVLGELSLEEQISIVRESAIFVSVIGGSASTAMFMERNTCLILYYNDIDDFVKGAPNGKNMPNMMDWDFWNNASYLRVQWLPIQSMDSDRDLGVFQKLLENEIDSLPYML